MTEKLSLLMVGGNYLEGLPRSGDSLPRGTIK